MNSYLITSNTLSYEIKNLNEIDQILKESPNDYFVFITYNNDEYTMWKDGWKEEIEYCNFLLNQ